MKRTLAVSLAVLVLAVRALAQTDFEKVQVVTTPLGHGLAMLADAGGNVVVSTGEDGVILVDDQFDPLHDKIKAAIAKLSDKPLRFVLNTHWHGDHTGGNLKFAADGAVVVAQDNVYQRMSTEQFIKHLNRTVPASPKGALPVVTFNDRATLHLNGETIHLIHAKNAHTDGDVLVHFLQADVLHMGDCFFNGMYPILDTGTGGTIDGYIAAVEEGLKLAGPATKVVPGHGILGTRGELAAFAEMLKQARERVARMKAQGDSEEDVVSARPTASLDSKWGNGFVKADAFVRTVYETLPAAAKP